MGVTRRLTDEETVPVMEAAGLEPLEPYPGADVPWRCRCRSCGSDVAPRYNGVRQGRGCQVCGKARRGVTRREGNEEEATALVIAAGLTPLVPYPGSRTPWLCRCDSCGREVTPQHSSIKQGRGGCGYCVGRRLDPQEAVRIMKAAGLTPLEPYSGKAASAWRCQCDECEREVFPWYSSVQQGNGGCVWCAQLKVDPQLAVQLMQDAGLKPLEPYPGSSKPWRCLCGICGNETSPAYGGVQQGHGCRYCGQERANSAKRLSQDEVTQDMLDAGFTPLEPYQGSGRPWHCRCVHCGQDSFPWHSAVRSQGTKCRYCFKHGFEKDKLGLLYVVEHLELNAVKVGIMGLETRRSDRLGLHEVNGWKIVKVWEFDKGFEASFVEDSVLRWWREDKQIPQALTKDQMPQRGETETASLSSVGTEETIEFIERAIAEIPVN